MRNAQTERPRLSVILATQRNPESLQRCLGALIAQNLPPGDYEIIVADDDASIRTRSLIEAWQARAHRDRGGPDIRYVPVVKTHGHAAARNAGLRQARGEVLAFTDDDCIPDPHWLKEGLRAFESQEVIGAWGRLVVVIPGASADKGARALLGQGPPDGLRFVTANCFFRRDAVERAGGFDERFEKTWHEASDLQNSIATARKDHILRHGWKASFPRVDAAVVVHPVSHPLWEQSIHQARQGMYDVLLEKKHPTFFQGQPPRESPWPHYVTTASLLVAAWGLFFASPAPRRRWGFLAGTLWLGLIGREFQQRLSDHQGHALESAAEAIVIPPLAAYWRLRGAIRFRTL